MADRDLTSAQQAEIDAASINALRQEPADDVRQWLQDVHSATLSTLSTSAGIQGFPACSVVPFALDQEGAPFILIAQIAAHTRNLKADSRASLFIRQGLAAGDPQSQWRATLTGNMERLVVLDENSEQETESSDVVISRDEYLDLKARYRERVPKSDSYFETHDFGFWRMRAIKKVRYIAGFGRICWFNGAHVLKGSSVELSAVAEGAIEHMNEDHLDALALICRAHHKVEPENIRMTALDSRGFFMEHDGTPSRFYTSFGTQIDAEELRVAMVKITRAAKAVLETTA